MLDAAKQRDWYRRYLAVALMVPETLPDPQKWARAMSLIAEQFVESYEDHEGEKA